MVETFDVVHIRLLVLGLPQGSWGLACKNLYRLLKPSGWLQWEEGDFQHVSCSILPPLTAYIPFTLYRSMKVLNHVPGASRYASERLRDTVIKDGLSRGQGWNEATKLVKTLSGAGFGRVYVDVFSSDRVSGLRGKYSNTSLVP
jgi:hypothetical protein